MSRSNQAIFWRRRAVAALLLVGVVVLLTHLFGTGRGSARGRRDLAAAHALDKSRRPRRHAAHATSVDPFTTGALRSYVARREGHVSAAVEDLNTGVTYLYNPGVRAQTASIVKVDILETLLHKEQDTGPLDEDDTDLSTGMIENSDNDDATALWEEDDGSTGIAAYNELAGLKDTVPNDDDLWGETMTSASDQLALLRHLVLPNSLLNTASRDYQLGLMSQVESDQRWGVSGGVPSTAKVELKNGWVPLTSGTDWEVNSMGHISGGGRNYLLAVLTAHDDSEGYGIDTIEKISSIVWNDLG